METSKEDLMNLSICVLYEILIANKKTHYLKVPPLGLNEKISKGVRDLGSILCCANVQPVFRRLSWARPFELILSNEILMI